MTSRWRFTKRVLRAAALRYACIAALALTYRILAAQPMPAELKERFKQADSTLTALAQRPESRMKEIAPVEELFNKALFERPEFELIMRTNSKGLIVNIVSRGDSSFNKNTDVSIRDWYGVPQDSKRPYHGPFNAQGASRYAYWSRPIIIRNSIGTTRFGGVIAVKIHLTNKTPISDPQNDSAVENTASAKNEGSKQKTLTAPPPANQAPNASVAKESTNGSPGGASESARLLDAGASGDKPTSSRLFSGGAIIAAIAGGCAIVALFIAVLVFRKKTPADDGSALEEQNIQAMQQTFRDEITPEIRETVREEIRTAILQTESDSLKSAARAAIEDEMRSEIRQNEAEAIREKARNEVTDAWREDIKEKYQEELHSRELETLKKLVHEKLIEKEMPLLVESHRVELSRSIRQNLTDTISADLECAEREELTARIRAEVKEESDGIRNRLREEMVGSIQRELKDRDYETILDAEREQLARRIRNEIVEKDLPAIHDDLVRRITEEEHKRVDESERAEIVESERRRLREAEGQALREEIRALLREEESEAMHASIKAEIYTETVQSIKTGLEEKYKIAFDKKLEDFKEAYEIRARGEIKGIIKAGYQNLLEHAEKISHSMATIEALDSLSQTIALLTNEKKKYKYFNLNTAQTESLLDYLKRVHNRFNIFLDNLDGGIREITLKIGAVMSSLDDGK
jgi:hypothetical protein